MAAEEDLTWDLAVPTRPTLSQVGGADLEDAEGEDAPSYEGDMPYAHMLNQWAKQIAALGRVSAACKLTIEFAAGVPFVDGLSSAGTQIIPGTFTITDNADGDTTVEWPANTFPAYSVDPQLTINETGDFRGVAYRVTNGVRVETYDSSGTLADARFTVVLE